MTPKLGTYRLQLQRAFDFDQAAGILEYVRALGVSHVYLSPVLQAVSGSTHGYDVVDHDRISRDLGGETAFNRLAAEAHRLGLALLADIVPNHMAIAGAENRWWFDVLENGASSHFAAYFDVDWEPSEARLRNAILLPVLANQYGRELEQHAIALVRTRAAFRIRYRDQEYPVAPESLAPILERAASRCGSEELGFVADALRALPRPTAGERASARRRRRDADVLAAHVDRVLQTSPPAAAAVDEIVRAVNADADALHALLEAQHYRLAWWRAAGRDLGYRRFFDINSLIALRMEDPQVFADTHRLMLQAVQDGRIDGLRIDHPDGLRDPREYLERLRAAAPDAWIVVEKILQTSERLPEDWPVAGTTGYDFLNRVTGLFVDPAGEAAFTRAYQTFTGDLRDYAQTAHDCRVQVLRDVLGSDVNRLAHLLVDICERHRRHRDYPRQHLADAVCEVLGWFPVYRTYVEPARRRISAEDRAAIARACADAARERPDLDPPLFEFLGSLLRLDTTGTLESEFVARFQQLSVSATAKGIEDTAFYVYTRFVALNDVGGDPARWSVRPADAHAAARETLARWPETLTTTATHDAKRGEDVRARLVLLSEMPDAWTAALVRWAEKTAAYHVRQWPDRHTEYLFYQTLVGAWPIGADRLVAYMSKAAHEAKIETTWIAPHAAYDDALAEFVRRALADESFMADVAAFVEPLVTPGRVTSLAQTLVKLLSPGVPDFYQGTEDWSLTLVDPDNRAPVDFDLRRSRLADLTGQLTPEAIWRRADEGLPKLWVIQQGLRVRRDHAEAIGPRGEYLPLDATGRRAAHAFAFARGGEVVTVVPRLVIGLHGDWQDTAVALPPGRWRDVFGGTEVCGVVPLADLLKTFPVALMERL